MFAQRLSYTGELGWEIFVTPDFAEHVAEILIREGQNFGLKLVGGEALNALRIEMGFVHWGHEMAYTESPHQLGLGFACKTDKSIPFIGRDAYLARRSEGEGPYLASVVLSDSQTMLHHNEPVLLNGNIVGYVTSGAYSAQRDAAVGLCLVTPTASQKGRANLPVGDWRVRVEGQDIPASVSLGAIYDPKVRQ